MLLSKENVGPATSKGELSSFRSSRPEADTYTESAVVSGLVKSQDHTVDRCFNPKQCWKITILPNDPVIKLLLLPTEYDMRLSS
jgi:hypothetical protein